jgi:hypothetical protein
MKTAEQSARANAYQFTTKRTANNFKARHPQPVLVLLGENGMYLVPQTVRETETLLAAGYESAD